MSDWFLAVKLLADFFYLADVLIKYILYIYVMLVSNLWNVTFTPLKDFRPLPTANVTCGEPPIQIQNVLENC